MMHYYFERSIVKPLMQIRRDRRLPFPGELTVRAGQEVSPVQVVARGEEPVDLLVLNAGERLGISAAELTKYLAVDSGQQVERGRSLWRKKSFLRGARTFKSPVDGLFLGVTENYLVLQPLSNLVELRAMIPARVVGVTPNFGVALECEGALIQAVWSTGLDGYGKLKVVSQAPNASLTADHLTADVRGAILVTGHVAELELLQQAEELGARGLIVGSLSADLLLAAQSLSLSIVVTDGIGRQPMAAPIFDLLAQAEEREASLFAHDPRDRGSRPEIVIPLPMSGVAEPPPTPPLALAVGQRVRLLREPYSSQIGEIVAVYQQPQLTEIGGQWPGVDVQLSGGEIVFAPGANLDLLV